MRTLQQCVECLGAVVLAVFLLPVVLGAQQQPAGVVTTLQGTAELTRPTQPLPTSLRFKDAIFVRDVINTKEKSIARVLFGGKSTVTVRELSRLEVREENLPGGASRSIHELSSGAILVNVAKQLMRPGDEVQIRTPNAVAAVHGTILYVDCGQGRANPSCSFTVLTGEVTLTPQGRPAMSLPANSTASVTGSPATGIEVSPVTAIAPTQATQILQQFDVQVALTKEVNQQQIAVAQAEQASQLARAVVATITGTDPGPTPGTTTTTQTQETSTTTTQTQDTSTASATQTQQSSPAGDQQTSANQQSAQEDAQVIQTALVSTSSTSSTETSSVTNPTTDLTSGSVTTAPLTPVIEPQANLSVTRTVTPASVTVGSDIIYTITVTNVGPSAATGVVLTDSVPAGTTFVSATASQGSCGGGAGINCNLGNINSGSSSTVTVTVTATAPGTITETATVSSSVNDPVPADNTVVAQTTILPAPPPVQDLVITGATDPNASSFNTGAPVTFRTITQSGGALTGTDAVTASSAYDWTGGIQSGAGSTNITTGATLTISGPANKTLDTRTLNNAGTATFSGGALFLNNGALFNNSGTFNAQDNTNVGSNSGPAGRFTNTGTFSRSGVSTTTAFAVPFDNAGSGSVQINSGTLSLAGGGTSSGSMSGAGTLSLDSGYTFAPRSSITASNVLFNAGTANVQGNYDLAGSSTTVSGGTANFGGTVGNVGNLTITGGTANFSGDGTVAATRLTQTGGVLTGSDAVNVSSVGGTSSWTGGTQSGGGATNLEAGTSLSISGFPVLDGRTINNAGAANFTGGSLQLVNGATVNNTGSFTAQNDTTISGGGTFNNSGAFVRSAAGTATTIAVPFSNATAGSVQANSGTLNFAGPIANTGSIVANGGTLQFQNNVVNNTGGTIAAQNNGAVQLSGATVSGGSLATSTGGVIRNVTNSTLSGLTITSGSVVDNADNQTLHLSGSIANSGTISNSSTGGFTNIRIADGTTLSGSGVLTMSDNANSRIVGEVNTDRLVNNSTIQGSGQIGGNAMGLTNLGTIIANQSNPLTIDTSAGFSNQGTLQANSGSTLTVIDSFINAGTVNVNSGGTVNLEATGPHTGAFNVSGVLNLLNGLVSAGAGQTLNPTGTILNINGGAVTANGATPLFNLSGGILNVLGSNKFLLSMNGGSATLVGRLLGLSGGSSATVNSLFSLSGNSSLASSTALLNVSSGSSLTVTGNSLGSFGSGTNSLSFTTAPLCSSGTCVPINSSGFNILLTNGAVIANVSIDPTFVGFSGLGGTNSVTGVASNQAIIVVDGATSKLSLGSNALPNLVITGVADSRNFSSGTNPNFFLANISGGTLSGSDTVSIVSSTTWTGGTQSGTGVTNANGGLNISGPATKFLDTRTLNSPGVTNFSGGNLALANGAAFNNTGTFNALDSASITGTNGSFNNSGAFVKSGVGTATEVSIAFNNTGTGSVQINSGSLRLAGGGTGSGSFSGAGNLDVASNYTFGPASNVTTSNVLFESGAANVQGTYNLAGSSTTVSGGSANFTGTVGNVGNLSIGGGTANFSSGEMIAPASLTMSGGTLTGSDTVSLTGAANSWTGGTQNGSGATNVQAGATLGISGTAAAKFVDTRTLNNAGTVNVSGSNLFLSNGASINNAGSFNVLDGMSINGNPSGTINNAGTFTKSGVGTLTTLNNVQFNNNGTTQVNGGSLSVAAGGTSTGSFIVAPGAELTFSNGAYNLNAGSSFSGGGNVAITGGSLNVGSATSSARILLNGGQITGSGTFTSNGALDWTGTGSAMTGTGSTDIGSTGTLTISNLVGSSEKTLDTRTLNNAGTANVSGANLFLNNGAVINNTGSFNILDGVNISGGPSGTINNAGTFTKLGTGTSTTLTNVQFNNSGSAQVNSGSLSLAAGGTSSGTFNIASGADLTFSNGTYNLNPGSTFSGAGNVNITSGSVSVGGATSSAHVVLNGGQITGSGSFTSGGAFDWTGTSSSMSGTGSTDIGSTGTLTISNLVGSSEKTLDTRTLNNAGTANVSGANVFLNNGAVINNTGTFNILDGVNFSGGPSGTINNSGTFTKSGAGTSTTLTNVQFNNSGSADVQSGTLRLSAATTNSGTMQAENGASLDIQGSFTNTGTIATNTGAIVNVSNSGAHTGAFNVSGNLNLLSGLVGAAAGQTLNPTGTILNVNGGTVTANGITPLFNLTGGAFNLAALNSHVLNMSGGNITLNNGLFSLTNGSSATINSLFSIAGGGSFTIVNNALLNVSGGSAFRLTSNSLGAFGAGTNTLSFGNAPLCGTSCVQLGNTGFNVLLSNGAVITNISIDPDFNGLAGLGGTNTVAGLTTGGNRALIVLDGPNSQLLLGQNALQPLIITSGTTDFSGGTNPFFATANISGGNLTGSDIVTINGLTSWSGGTMSGTGVTNANGGLEISGAGTKTLDTRTLNSGETNLSGDLVVLTNGATLNAAGPFNNTGTLDVQSGTAILLGGGTSTGTFNVESGSLINFSGGVHDLNSGAALTGGGEVRVIGTVNLNDSGIDHLTGTLNVANGSLNVIGDLMHLQSELFGAGGTMVRSVGGTININNQDVSNLLATPNVGGQAADSIAIIANEKATVGTLEWAYIPVTGTGQVNVIDVNTNNVIKTVSVGSGTNPVTVAATPDQDRIYVLNSGSVGVAPSVSVIDVHPVGAAAANNIVATLPLGNDPNSVVFTPDSSKAFITNSQSGTVTVVDNSTGVPSVIATIPVGTTPKGASVTPDGTKVYVANAGSNTVSVINTATNAVTTVNVGTQPIGLEVSPDGTKVGVVNKGSNSVSIIDVATNTVQSIGVGATPSGGAITPNGKFAYVSNQGSGTVSVINMATNTRVDVDPSTPGIQDIAVGTNPTSVVISTDSRRVYVANGGSNSVSVIDTATNNVVGTINFGSAPLALALARETADLFNLFVVNDGSNNVSVVHVADTSDLIEVAGGSVLGVNNAGGTAALSFGDAGSSTTVNTAGTLLRIRDAGSTVTVQGPILSGVNTSFNVDRGFLRLNTGGSLFAGPGSTALFGLSGSTPGATTVNTVTALFNIQDSNSALVTGAPLFSANNTNFTLGPSLREAASFLSIEEGALVSSNTPAPFISLAGSNISRSNSFFSLRRSPDNVATAAAMILSGPLADISNSSITTNRNFIQVLEKAALVQNGSETAPLLNTGNSIFNIGDPALGTASNDFFVVSDNSGASVQGPATVSLSGPLLIDSGSTFNGLNRLFTVGSGSTFGSTTPNALIQLSGSQVTTASNIISMGSNSQVPGTTMGLFGPMLTAANATFNPGNAFMFVGDSSMLIGPPKPAAGDAPALLNFVDSTVCPSPCASPNAFFSMRRSLAGNTATEVSLGGPLLSSVGSNFNNSTFISVQEGAEFTGTGNGALVQTATAPSTVTTTGSFMVVNDLSTGNTPGTASPAHVNVAGGILSDTSGSTFNIGSRFLNLSIASGIASNGSTLTSTSSLPAFSFNNSSVTTGNDFGLVSGIGSDLSLANSFFSASGGTFTLGARVFNVNNGGVVSASSANPFVNFSSSTVSTPNSFAQISGVGSRVTLGGSFLNATGGALSFGTNAANSDDILRIDSGGQLVMTSTADPVLSFDGGTHSVGTVNTPGNLNSRIVLDRGVATDPTTGLGTDQPIKGPASAALPGAANPVGTLLQETSGAMLEVKGQTGVGTAIRVDTALLEATLPLIKLIGTGTTDATQTKLITNGASVDAGFSKIVSLGPVIALDNGLITVNNGPLINLRQGTTMDVAGDLLSLTNGSKINVVNGPLILVTGNSGGGTSPSLSTLNVGGGLVNFGGSGGNTIVVNNSILPNQANPTATAGIPVSGANISITNPIKNSGLGSITINGVAVGSGGTFTGSLIQTQNGGRVTISGH